ncbi:hypothetical protein [Clostridium estertheticum]|uniref:hypothetical protein n=1 Tax=Clostridium estertheticum TaxID=238834 RepID=UPI001C0CE5AF|nr:hypothetical protein [Clostridium estertheticum]MBU3186634.1 hypothetical protein [Clostridium estertheticum]
MKNELVRMFESQEVKVITDEGVTLINLVHTAKCCGLIRSRGNGIVIRWDDIKKKLNSILTSVESSTPEYTKEITFILDEIANTDDRNSIYMSSWLSKRLAMECNSKKSMEYKNFLATLDEKFSKGEIMKVDTNTQIANMVGTVMTQMIPTLMKELASQFVPIMVETKEQINIMTGLMHDQSEIYSSERNELKELIGFKSVNTKRMVDTIKETLSEKHGRRIMASDIEFLRTKKYVFKEFKVIKWEDIPVEKFSRVHAFIDSMEVA